jgi:hypothetical protein
MLSQELRRLERDGSITRRVHAEVPPRVEYRLTNLGQSLMTGFSFGGAVIKEVIQTQMMPGPQSWSWLSTKGMDAIYQSSVAMYSVRFWNSPCLSATTRDSGSLGRFLLEIRTISRPFVKSPADTSDSIQRPLVDSE